MMTHDPGAPRGLALSNGRFTTVVTDAGGGYSSWRQLRLTRWSPDPLRPGDGVSLYVRDLDTGAFARVIADHAAEATLLPGRFILARELLGIEAALEVCVAADDDAEVRRLTLRNPGPAPRRLDVTTCLELVLNSAAADAAHPAFSKLFVQTDFVADSGAVLAWRRPRGPGDEPLCVMHLLRFEESDAGAPGLQVETDRMRFLGRARTMDAPAALTTAAPLSGTTGSVLDPVASLRRGLVLGAGQTARLVAVTAAAASREQAEELARRLGAAQSVEPIYAAAAARAARVADGLHMPPERVAQLPALTGALLFGAPSAAIVDGARDASGRDYLRSLGLRGAPLVLAHHAHADGPAAITLGRYWRRQGLPVDVLVLVQDAEAVTALREAADRATAADAAAGVAPRLGSTVVLAEAGLPEGVEATARTAARVVLAAPAAGAAPASLRSEPVPSFRPAALADADDVPGLADTEPLQLFNGLGGFAADGREYVIRLEPTPGGLTLPPLPWTHVVANEQVGFIASERGLTHTWSGNSREHRLTPWHNDPVSDPPGEALWVRDEDAGIFWSPTPGPTPAPAAYEVRWGHGYARWRLVAFGVEQEVTAFVAPGAPLRVVRLRLRNTGPERRRLTLFSYLHWVLGVLPGDSPFLTARVEAHGRAVFARNPAAGEFADRVAVAAAVPLGRAQVAATADRAAFLGAGGDLANPQALREASGLDGRPGTGLDACAAFEVSLELRPGETGGCDFLLGDGRGEEDARALWERYGSAEAIDVAFEGAVSYWRDLLGRVRVETPSPAIDLMTNGWAAYQDLCCRMLARTAFYQSGGAYGFRDQLQDAAALVYLQPALTRDQIVLHAAHQFVEGDVLHWWHPPLDKGIRTRFSDDLLWLPYITAFYVGATGDESVLDESVPFLRARELEPGEDEAFLVPEPAGESASVYEHCCRAVDRSLAAGAHGLPLIGTGDWNDGMNRVGREGRGESVWLGFFLYQVLEDFGRLARERGDAQRALRYAERRAALGRALNDGGWDGEWYRRAYYDDGAPLGSAQSDECRIDAIAQAWAVLSGAASPERAASALDALEHYLVRESDGLIALLTPPFDRTPHDPGYIKGYIPGVRENGGQYTHGALWAVRALAEAGRCERAARLLELLSPVSHTRTPEEVAVYRVEPYVVAADVYGVAPHVGRGGWTWYTGSAGWMLRVALESVLGLTLHDGTTLRLRPCIPVAWPGFALHYRLPGDAAVYDIRVTRGPAATQATLDGEPVEVEDGAVVAPLIKDGRRHVLHVTLGDDVGPRYRPR